MRLTESENVELKKSTSELKAGIISLAAMLNKHQRGELWFGIKNSGETTQKTAQKTTQKTTQKIIEEIRKNPQITRKELSVVIGLTEEGIKYHLSKMQNKGQIRRTGPDKGGHWEIIGK